MIQQFVSNCCILYFTFVPRSVIPFLFHPRLSKTPTECTFQHTSILRLLRSNRVNCCSYNALRPMCIYIRCVWCTRRSYRGAFINRRSELFEEFQTMKGTRNVTAAQTASGEAAHGARGLLPPPSTSSYAFVHFCTTHAFNPKTRFSFFLLVCFFAGGRCVRVRRKAESFRGFSWPYFYWVVR